MIFEFCRKRLYAGPKGLEEIRISRAAMGECVNTHLNQKVGVTQTGQKIVLSDGKARVEAVPFNGEPVVRLRKM